jgi:small subunit ribosomal protein S2
MRAIKLYTSSIADAILEGRASVSTGEADDMVEVAAESEAAAE